MPTTATARFSLAALALAACGENLTHPDGAPPYQAPDAALACLPNLDGLIEASEMQAAVGVPASFLVSTQERQVDLTGVVDGAGHLVWDWSAPAQDDRALEVAAAPVGDRWYASSFPGAQFVMPLDAGATLEAIYSKDDQALWLHGTASAQESPAEGQTLLVYEQPVAVTRFPVQPGASWTATGRVAAGTFRGLPYVGQDVYEVAVDATGQLHLPDLSFTQVHRVRTRVTVEPSVGSPTSRRQVSFLFECFGEVARAASRDNETAEDFTTAAELRRMGL